VKRIPEGPKGAGAGGRKGRGEGWEASEAAWAVAVKKTPAREESG